MQFIDRVLSVLLADAACYLLLVGHCGSCSRYPRCRTGFAPQEDEASRLMRETDKLLAKLGTEGPKAAPNGCMHATVQQCNNGSA